MINYLGMARASAGESRTQFYIALDQKYIIEQQFKETFALAETCARQIANFMKYLEANPRPRRISDGAVEYEV